MAPKHAIPKPKFGASPGDAFQPPRDPLRGAVPGVIARELPVSTTNGQWSWGEVRGALNDFRNGAFNRPAQLIESVLWDPRVQASMGSRTGGLLGREVKFQPAQGRKVKGSRAAREVFDAWVDAWPTIANDDAFAHMHSWGVMAFGLSQMLWDDSVFPWIPHLTPFDIRHTYYQPSFRKLMAMTLDGQIPVEPGNGHWVLNAPYTPHRGWLRGALPALAQPWIQRTMAYRDVARFCERHGFPMFVAKVPALGDPLQIQALRNALANLGQESVLELPQGLDPGNSYSVDTLEAKSTTYEVFPESIGLCNADISLAILWQNLTTEIKEGSFAAARMHGDVRQAAIEFDNRGESRWVHSQVARPFSLFNYGDADLAPWTSRDVEPYEDHAAAAAAFSSFANALTALRSAGIMLKNPGVLAARMGIRLDDAGVQLISPTQVETAKVGSARRSGVRSIHTSQPRMRRAA